jgi:hypothetical protein
MDKLTDNQEITQRWLTEEELSTFREDYRELEKEIQSFFSYILSLRLNTCRRVAHRSVELSL